MSEQVLIEQIPARAMVVCAHPDDAELSAGATLAKWIANGTTVALVLCTDGSAGTASAELSHEVVSQQRRAEQQAAAEALGVHHLEMLNYSDGSLEDTVEFRAEIVRLIRQYRPTTLLTHDPTARNHFAHRDHRITGTVAQDAVYPYARDRLHFPDQLRDGLEPHKVQEALFWDADQPNAIVDVSSCLAPQHASLACHKSQLAGLDTGGASLDQWLAQRASQAAINHPFAHGEAFRRLVAPK